jgi:hypothetical protein
MFFYASMQICWLVEGKQSKLQTCQGEDYKEPNALAAVLRGHGARVVLVPSRGR